MYTPRKKYTRKKTNKPSHKEKENSYLETAAKLLTFISPFAMIFGGFTAFAYLKSIQHPDVFTETISHPYSFIAILMVSGILSLLVFTGFIAPYAISLGKYDASSENWKNFLANEASNKIFLILLIPHALYIYFLIGFLTIPAVFETIDIANYFEYLLWTMIASPILPLTLYFLTDRSKPISKRVETYFTVFFYSFIASSLGLSFPVYTALHIVQWTPKNLNQFLPLISYECMILLNLLFVASYSSSRNNKKNKEFIIFIPATLSYLSIYISSIFVENVPFRLLYPIRLVESSNEASWYLLNRNNSTISDEDLKIIKSHFTPHEIEQKKNEEIKICTKKAEWLRNAVERNNALFGYMAWNFGNKKIFCPATVNNIEAPQIKDTYSKCLTIEGKALQKIHKSYISSHSMTP